MHNYFYQWRKQVMARLEIKYDNHDLKNLLEGYTNYYYLTEEGRTLLKNAIRNSVPKTSQKSISVKDIFFLIRSVDEISTQNISFWMNLRSANKRGGKPYSTASIKIYKRAAVKAAQDILEAHNNGVVIVNWKVADEHYMTGEQEIKLVNMKNNKRSIESMIQYLQTLI